jgi:hypothetical protein
VVEAVVESWVAPSGEVTSTDGEEEGLHALVEWEEEEDEDEEEVEDDEG